jgi:8-hydroxy-5-deazaflavin:NADPH oxidoreductase
MITISIIGSGTMAAAIAGRVAKAGHTVELVNRDNAKAAALANQVNGSVTTGTYAEAPKGSIVFLAVPYAAAAAVVEDFGDALNGKIVVDVANPVASDMSGLVTPAGSSGAQETAKGLPADAHMIKALNTIFGHVLAKDEPLDAFLAGDDANAKERVKELLKSLELRPFDVGGLHMAQTLENVGLMMIGLARNGAGTWNFALTVDLG